MTASTTETGQLSSRQHFEAAVNRYQGALLRYVRSNLGGDDAQEVVQEVFLRLHKTMRKNGLRDVGALGAWLFRVAHNCTADVLRRKGRRERAGEMPIDPPEPTVETSELDEIVHREDCRLALTLLEKLPARERQVLLLKVEQGMSYRQISDVTRLALGTVGYLMNQGLGRLARELKATGAI